MSDYDENQFVSRQLILLIAEVGELADHIAITGLPSMVIGGKEYGFYQLLEILRQYADDVFGYKELWQELECCILDRQGAISEASNCAIVALNALAALRGDDNDIRLKAGDEETE